MWMLSRGKFSGPSIYLRALLDADNDKDKACLALEAKGQLLRLEQGVLPTRFPFPVIGKNEVKLMRMIEKKIRRGRISTIGVDGGGDIMVTFEKGQGDWVLSRKGGKEHTFVHCTSPGPFHGRRSDGFLFNSEREMGLDLLFDPPISISMSCLAKLEVARRQETLDVSFGRKLLKNDSASPNEILSQLIKGMVFKPENTFLEAQLSIINQALFIALLDRDPMVGYNWLKSNRLSAFSIPGNKVHLVEDMHTIVSKGSILGSPSDQIEISQNVAEKLKPLHGK